jgi:hypothetical protein
MSIARGPIDEELVENEFHASDLEGGWEGQLRGSLCDRIHERHEERRALGLQRTMVVGLDNSCGNLNGGSTCDALPSHGVKPT